MLNNQISLKQKEALIAHRESTGSGKRSKEWRTLRDRHSATQHRRVSDGSPNTPSSRTDGPIQPAGQFPLIGALQQLLTLTLLPPGRLGSCAMNRVRALPSRPTQQTNEASRCAKSSVVMQRALIFTQCSFPPPSPSSFRHSVDTPNCHTLR